MTHLVRSCCLAAALVSGGAWAQQAPANSDNPHSTRAKDRQGTDTPSSITNKEVEQAETGNPDSLKNKDVGPAGQASGQGRDAAERGNPDSIQNKDRDKLGTRDQAGLSQMGDMDHDEMMNDATPAVMLQRLHLSNLHEIDFAKLAEQNGTDRIKPYAKSLESEHQDADEKVQALAKKEKVTLSDTLQNPQMSKHVQLAKDRLSGLKGTDFDRAFATRMSMEHKHVIAMAQGWRKNCKDQDVCSLVDSLLPMLQRQAQMADQLKMPAAQGRAPNTR